MRENKVQRKIVVQIVSKRFKVFHHCSAPVAPHLDSAAKSGRGEYAPFIARLNALVSTGLVEWVPHLYESDNRDAEPIHPFGLGNSDSIEDRIGRAAHAAGRRLLTEGQAKWANDNGLFLVPVPRHVGKVCMIGIARLRYRPRTLLTAAWWADLHEGRANHSGLRGDRPAELQRDTEGGALVSRGSGLPGLQDQGCIKVGMKETIKEEIKRVSRRVLARAHAPFWRLVSGKFDQ